MAERVERLTNLLALLLETTEPLSLAQITAELVGQYPPSEVAQRQAFERDKAALRDLGVPIDTEVVVGGPYAGQTRYRIDRRKYELADLDLAADETHALQVAVAAVRTGTSAGRSALWKIGGALADEAPIVAAIVPDRPELPVIRAAVATRSSIGFAYRGEQRHLEPWGLLLRNGFWYVIGRDVDRGEQRTFRVDRFDGGAASVQVGPANAFTRPADFDPRTSFPSDPKLIGPDDDEIVEATVWVDATFAGRMEREVGADRVLSRRSDGSIEVLVPANNVAAFRSWLLGMLEHAAVIGPDSLRDHVVEWLRGVA